MLSGLSSCCCSDAQDKNNLSFGNFSTDESSVQVRTNADRFGTRPYGGPGPQVPQVQQLATTTPVSAAKVAVAHIGDDGSTARSLTEEEKQAEKARLQSLVNTFAKRAVRGCTCAYIREGAGERLATQYRIDKSLEYLSVMSLKDPGLQEV